MQLAQSLADSLQPWLSQYVPDANAVASFARWLRLLKRTLALPMVMLSVRGVEGVRTLAADGVDEATAHRLAPLVTRVLETGQPLMLHELPLPALHFYAGLPIFLAGQPVAVLSLLDFQPRSLSAAEHAVWQDVADGMLQTIQQQRAAVQSLAQEARVRAVLNTVIDGIITIDAQGCIQACNPMAEAIFGYAAAEMLGGNISMLMPEPYRSEHDHYLQRYLATGQARVIGVGREMSGLRKDGTVFPMELAVNHLLIDGQDMFTGVVRDITERKQHERMKEEFISTVSHELRTPLTSIRGALGLVLGKFSGSLPDKAKQLLETASRNCERLCILINDILDLEKLTAGHLALELKVVDLVALTRQAIVANEGYALQHAVRLRLLAGPTQVPVRVDEHRILQVFANLLSNAVKYSPRGGEVQIGIQVQQEQVRVVVQDFGRGIPEHFRSRIFQRFSQADSSDTREKGGTGLGLSIVKTIVELHEGRIDYRSQTQQGTTFFFDLPLWLPQTISAPDALDAALPRVLICEDNADVARVLSEMLAQDGVASDRAATAADAFAMLQRAPYQALLLDLGLPDVDGLTLIQQLRNHPPTREMSVIVVSGRAQNVAVASWHAEVLPIVDWVQKPIDRERLKQAVTQALKLHIRARILHVEDDADVVEVTRAMLEDQHEYVYARSVAEAREKLQTGTFDLLLLDMLLPDGVGACLLGSLDTHLPVVMFSNREIGIEVRAQVAAALVKANTSRDKLLATIRQVLQQEGN